MSVGYLEESETQAVKVGEVKGRIKEVGRRETGSNSFPQKEYFTEQVHSCSPWDVLVVMYTEPSF